MKKGYVVCNITNYSDTPEIFGVYSNLKTAERRLRKVVRKRYGRCPRDTINIVDMPEEDTGDSYSIVAFEENDGD